jgi:hypothetical protein
MMSFNIFINSFRISRYPQRVVFCPDCSDGEYCVEAYFVDDAFSKES